MYIFPDLTTAPATLILNMINTLYGASWPRLMLSTDLVLGDPQAYGALGANTVIPYGTSSPTVFGIGPATLRYRRIDVSELYTGLPPTSAAYGSTLDGITLGMNPTYNLDTLPGIRNTELSDATAVNTSDLLSLINSTYGTNLATSDIVDHPIAYTATGANAFLECAPSSLIYCGKVTIKLVPPMSHSFTTTTLDGLTAPYPAV